MDRQDSVSRKTVSKKKSVVICVGIIALGAVLLILIYSTEPKAMREGATKETAMLVDVMTPEHGSFRPNLVVLGEVVAAEDIVLRPRVSGTIVSRSPQFLPGAVVRKDDVLVTIDPADYQNALKQRESGLAQAQAALQLERGRQNTAQLEYKFVEDELSEKQRELVLRKPQLDDAMAAVDAAKAAVDLAKLELERTKVRSPFHAQIVSREVNVGSQVSAGDPIARLVGVEHYWVEASVPVERLGSLTFPKDPTSGGGARAVIRNRTAWGEGVSREGSLYSFIGALEDQTRLARVIVQVSDPLLLKATGAELPKLLLGSFVEVAIEAKELSEVFRIPRDYLRKNSNVWLKESGRLVIRPVEVVFRDEEFVYVRKGLKPGDQIVTTNLTTVVEGAQLRLRANVEQAKGGA